MKSFCIHFHKNDELVAMSVQTLLCLWGFPVTSNKVTGGVVYPAKDNARSILIFSGNWDHTYIKNFLERLNPFVGQAATAILVVALCRDDHGFLKYLESCGAGIAHVSDCLKTILVHDAPVRIRVCRSSDPMVLAIHRAIGHKVGVAYTEAKERLAQILPTLDI